MTTPPKKNKLHLFLGFMSAQLIPAGFALFVALYLLPKTNLNFELAMPIAVAFGAIGAGIHYLSIKRGIKFRLIFSGIFLVFAIGAAFLLTQIFQVDHAKLTACQVCGFVSLEEKGAICPVCKVALTIENANLEEYESLDEFLRAEQIMYFIPVVPKGDIEFYAPFKGEIGYQKDADWKPSVTVEEIREVENALQETLNK